MRTTVLVISALAVILLLSQSSAGIIPYEVKGKTGEIEFRRYPEMVLATVDTTGDNAGFNLLFAYISGSNKPREKIPMTAFMVSDATSMSFVMPARITRKETPDPLDSPGPDRDAAGTGHCGNPVFGICTAGRRGCDMIPRGCPVSFGEMKWR